MNAYGLTPSRSGAAAAATAASTKIAGDSRHDRAVASFAAVLRWRAPSRITGSAVIVGSDREESQLRAGADRPLLRLTRSEFEDDACSALHRHAPWAHVIAHREHPELLVEEDHVDREAHEPGVDGGGRAEQQALAGRQLAPPQKAPQAPERTVGDGAARAQHALRFVGHCDGHAAHRPALRRPTRIWTRASLKPRCLTRTLTVPPRVGRTRIGATPFLSVRLCPPAPAPETR